VASESRLTSVIMPAPVSIWTRLALLCLVVTGAAGAFVFWGRGTPATSIVRPDEDGEWVTVRRGDFEILCREDGELKAVKVTSLQFLRWGKISFLIPEGTLVKKGDKVVSLDTKELDEELQHLQEDLSAAERALSQQEQSRDLDTKLAQTDLQAERERATFAKLKMSELLAKPLAIEKEEAANLTEGAQVRLSESRADWSAYKPLYELGFGQKNEFLGKQLAVDKAEVELKRNEMKSRIIMDGALPYEREKCAHENEQAQLVLKIKEIDVADQADNLNGKVRMAERAVTVIQRKLDRKKLDLERSSLVAPHDGIVVYRVMDFRGNKKPEVGEMVSPWLSPVELPNYSRMKVRTQVPESFIRKIRSRMPREMPVADPLAPKPAEVADKGSDETSMRHRGSHARVIVKTIPDRQWKAEVTWIDGWARDRNAKLSDADIKAQGLSGVRVFDVEVELEESDPARLREGFRASVEFPVETMKETISIPVNAITNRDGLPYVRIENGSTAEWRQIELGAQSINRVAVLKGLQSGDKIFAPRIPPPQRAPVEKLDESKEAAAPKKSRGGSGSGGPPGVDSAPPPPRPKSSNPDSDSDRAPKRSGNKKRS